MTAPRVTSDEADRRRKQYRMAEGYCPRCEPLVDVVRRRVAVEGVPPVCTCRDCRFEWSAKRCDERLPWV